jgi:plasmid stabilization system protein ParE
MDPKSVEFHEDAAREFLAAIEWYRYRNELVATRFARKIAQAVEQIATSPSRWPAYSHQTRRFVLRQFPFFVIYRELPNVVQVLAVAHAHRRPGYWKSRR